MWHQRCVMARRSAFLAWAIWSSAFGCGSSEAPAGSPPDAGVVENGAVETGLGVDSSFAVETGPGVDSSFAVETGPGVDSSSGSDAPATQDATAPSIDPGKHLSDLSNDERGSLCDWMYGLFGGYGQVIQCTMGTNQNGDQAECIASAFGSGPCSVTVLQFESCALARAPTKGCDFPTTECRPLLGCR